MAADDGRIVLAGERAAHAAVFGGGESGARHGVAVSEADCAGKGVTP
jgi:hypothetical protein